MISPCVIFSIDDGDVARRWSVSPRHRDLVRSELRATGCPFREIAAEPGRLGWTDPLNNDDCAPVGFRSCLARRHLGNLALGRFLAIARANAGNMKKSGPGDASFLAGEPSRWGVKSDQQFRAR